MTDSQYNSRSRKSQIISKVKELSNNNTNMILSVLEYCLFTNSRFIFFSCANLNSNNDQPISLNASQKFQSYKNQKNRMKSYPLLMNSKLEQKLRELQFMKRFEQYRNMYKIYTIQIVAQQFTNMQLSKVIQTLTSIQRLFLEYHSDIKNEEQWPSMKKNLKEDPNIELAILVYKENIRSGRMKQKQITNIPYVQKMLRLAKKKQPKIKIPTTNQMDIEDGK